MLSARARAGNDDGILIGGQAALTGGAVTAIGNDGAAAYYNPAGLAHITRQSFDLNGSAYGVSLFRAKHLFTLPDGSTEDASMVDWQLVPTALSYSRKLSQRVVGSFGIFIPTTSDVDLRASLRQLDGTKWTLGVDDVRNEYDYIASLGLRLSDTLRLGIALHGIYISTESMLQLASGSPQTAFLSASSHATVADYGLRIGLGVQWAPLPQLELGLSVQTPALTILRNTNSDEISSSFVRASNSTTFSSEHKGGLRSPLEFSTPLLMRLGGALRLGRAQLLLDGTLSSPLNIADPALDRRLSGNVRVGVLATLSERLSCGAGVFSTATACACAPPTTWAWRAACASRRTTRSPTDSDS